MFICVACRLSSLERFANRVEEVLDTSSSDASQHLFDPVNVFHLLNRYTNTWMKLHENVYRDNAQSMATREIIRYFVFLLLLSLGAHSKGGYNWNESLSSICACM